MVALSGGDSILRAVYTTLDAQALPDNALAALDGRRACPLSSHGMIVFGAGPESALAPAVEALAARYRRALRIGQPKVLAPGETRIVPEKFRNYRKPDPGARGELIPGRWPLRA